MNCSSGEKQTGRWKTVGIMGSAKQKSGASSFGYEAIAKQFFILRSLAKISCLGCQQAVAQSLHPASKVFGIVRGGPLIDHHFLELFLFAQVSENHVGLADPHLEHV